MTELKCEVFLKKAYPPCSSHVRRHTVFYPIFEQILLQKLITVLDNASEIVVGYGQQSTFTEYVIFYCDRTFKKQFKNSLWIKLPDRNVWF